MQHTLWNILPNELNGLNPTEIFTRTKMEDKALRSGKTWGCPAYVLDPNLQDGKIYQNGVQGLGGNSFLESPSVRQFSGND